MKKNVLSSVLAIATLAFGLTTQAQFLGSNVTTCKIARSPIIPSLTVYLIDQQQNTKVAYVIENSSSGKASFLHKSTIAISKSGVTLGYSSQNGRVRNIQLDTNGGGTINFGDGFSSTLTCGQ